MKELTDPWYEYGCQMNRRHFFSRLSMGIGGAALATLMGCATRPDAARSALGGVLDRPHIAPGHVA